MAANAWGRAREVGPRSELNPPAGPETGARRAAGCTLGRDARPDSTKSNATGRPRISFAASASNFA